MLAYKSEKKEKLRFLHTWITSVFRNHGYKMLKNYGFQFLAPLHLDATVYNVRHIEYPVTEKDWDWIRVQSSR